MTRKLTDIWEELLLSNDNWDGVEQQFSFKNEDSRLYPSL